jgi:hypothetical protein
MSRPRSIIWYSSGFKGFEAALESLEAPRQGIGELRERGVDAITVNSYLRCINAYHYCPGREFAIPAKSVRA